VLRDNVSRDKATIQGILHTVREVISPIAAPDMIWFVSGLPKTRSGKIMRRILRKVGEGEYEKVGDVTTLADPAVVQEIIATVQASRAGP
jgi:acetyl-CoA synthetase